MAPAGSEGRFETHPSNVAKRVENKQSLLYLLFRKLEIDQIFEPA